MLLPNFPTDPMQTRATSSRDVFPHNEVISQPFIEYSFFHADVPHAAQRRRRTISPRTSASGPTFDVTLAQALSPLGVDAHFTRPSLSARLDVPVVPRRLRRAVAPAFSLRHPADGDHDTIDNTAHDVGRARRRRCCN